ncbi:hypothetical protein MASR1M74_29860 [Lentimicrobium sp.]
MSEQIVNDTIQKSSEIISGVNSASTDSVNIWLWIALIELLIIIYLLFFKKNKKELSAKEKFKKESKEGEIDFGNIITSSFHVKPLYDELKVKCHPDRFPTDSEKNKIALSIFQEFSKNKTNYKKLIELKEQAKNELGIKF